MKFIYGGEQAVTSIVGIRGNPLITVEKPSYFYQLLRLLSVWLMPDVTAVKAMVAASCLHPD